MPEAGLSPNALLAVAATAALGSGLVHLLLTRIDAKHTVNKRPRRKSRRPQSAVPAGSGSDDSSEDTNSSIDVLPPPAPHSQRRSRKAKDLDDNLLFGAGRWGFSMEDARAHAEKMCSLKEARSPAQVLEGLQKGNARFWTGKATRPEMSAFQRRALIKQQFPSVAVLGCSDSRVPVEIVFDQGLGDIFVIRVAGNLLDTSTAASLEYAIVNLRVKVVVVMGHEGCGAIKAAMRPEAEIKQQPKQLRALLTTLKKGLDEDRLESIRDMKAHDREAVVTNVKVQIGELAKSGEVKEAVDRRELIVVGAFYEISSGIVDFFHEVSEIEVGKEPGGPNRPSRGVQSRFDPSTFDIVTESLRPLRRTVSAS